MTTSPRLSSFESVSAQASTHFRKCSEARDTALRLCRDSVRASANSIRAVHRGDRADSSQLRLSASLLISEAKKILAPYPQILFAGFVHDAEKEYVEACLTSAFTFDEPIDGPECMMVGWPAYLNGLGEAVGELRRRALDLLRQDRLQECERTLELMQEGYYVLTNVDFPDSITGGLRRTTDMVRAVLEKTRGDVTIAAVQHSAAEAISELLTSLRHERHAAGVIDTK